MTSSIVRKSNQLFDEGTQAWTDTYEVPGLEGPTVIVEVPREDQAPNTVRRQLIRKGAVKSAVENDTLLSAAIDADAPVVRRAARTGWRVNDGLFVSHQHVAGEMTEGKVVPPENPLGGAVDQLQILGTLEEWHKLVRVAKYSTAMIIALCAVFAAPLLALLQRPSFALVLFAASRAGKSFAQLVAGSAIGFGREEDLPTLNGTPAGLVALSIASNDHMLPVNEIGTAPGPKSQIYNAVHQAAYQLLSGHDKVRHPTWAGAGGGTPTTFKTIILMSSEYSPDEWAARNGETRDPGETARMIGVPVVFPGMRTIFDRPPVTISDDKLPAWEAEQFRHLRQELPHQRGVAFRDYTDLLVEDVDGHRERAQRLVATFERIVGKEATSPVGHDIVAKFGVLFAGGVIACEVGILPLSKKTVGQAVRDACIDALRALPDPERELRAVIELLRERLAGGSMLDLDNCSERQRCMMRNADGFHRRQGAGRLYVVRAKVFATWLNTHLRHRQLLEWLDDEGFLDHSRDRKNTRSNEWAQTHASWPDGTRVRSISIYLPSGLADLQLHG